MRPRLQKLWDFLFSQHPAHTVVENPEQLGYSHHLMQGGSGTPKPQGLTPEAKAAITKNTLKGTVSEWDEWVASL